MNGDIFRDGNVGIGTNNPTEKLKVIGNMYANAATFEMTDENQAVNSNNFTDWYKYSRSLSLGRMTNLLDKYERRFNFYDLPQTQGIFFQKSAAVFTIKDLNNIYRFIFNSVDEGETRIEMRDKFGNEIIKAGNLLPNNPNNPTNENISFLHLLEPNSRLSVGTWVFYKPDYQLTVKGKGWFENDLVTNGKIGVGIEFVDIPSGYKLAVTGKVICEEVKVQLQSD